MSIEDFEQKIRPSMGDWCVQLGLGDNLLIAITIYDLNRDAGYVDISWGYSRRHRGQNDPLFAPYASKHDKNYTPPELWREIEELPHPLVEPFKYVFGEPAMRANPTIHHQLVSLLIPQDDLSRVLERHKIVFMGDAVHDWTNHAGSAANAAIVDGVTLGVVIAESSNLESYYEQRRTAWQTLYDQNAQDFEALHKPQEEWDRLLAIQRSQEQGQSMHERL
jgi:monooxygenase